MNEWLDVIERSGARDRLELCVVDSGSPPEERERLKRDIAPRVDHLLLESNLGFGRASNRGAAATSAPVLIFTNPDTLLDTLPPPLHNGWPEGLLLGAINAGIDPPGAQGAEGLPTFKRQALDMALGRFGPPAFVREAENPGWVSGSSLAISRADFTQAGGFPEELFLFFEDTSLCLAHRRLGGRVAIDPEWKVRHPPERGAVGGRESLDAIARQSGRWFVRRNEGPLRAALLYLILALLYAPRRAAGQVARRHGLGAARRVILDLLYPKRVIRRFGGDL